MKKTLLVSLLLLPLSIIGQVVLKKDSSLVYLPKFYPAVRPNTLRVKEATGAIIPSKKPAYSKAPAKPPAGHIKKSPLIPKV